MSIFRKKKDREEDDGIVILRKTEENVCGGTDATLDTRAPKQILSEKMIDFDVASALPYIEVPRAGENNEDRRIGYISAFAVPAGEGVFLYLETGGFRFGDERKGSWALVREDLFPSLVKLVRENDLAKSNGYHSTTHGLPENFGGSVHICYESGETIDFSDNQSPIITAEAGRQIAEVFSAAMNGPRVALPDVRSLRGIRFEERRHGGGYTEAVLTLRDDGTAINRKEARYDGPTVYHSEKEVDAQTVRQILENIENCGMLAWRDLPKTRFGPDRKKRITFVFDGEEVCVTDDRYLPQQIGNGFFKIELEMTTKH